MDRQLLNATQKLQISNDQPGSSRQVCKPNIGRVPNFYKENANKNVSTRFQNKARNREHKISAKKIKNSIQNDEEGYLNTSSNLRLVSDVCHIVRKNPAKGFVKERFVQANCQFVVAGDHDYSEYLRNPDMFVPWECIEEVIFSCKNDDDLCCPICLHHPAAAKITRCGHIYCWSCVLHYLSLSDKKSRPCPICFHNINKLDLKSTTIVKKKNYFPEDLVTFNLMKIRKGSTLAVPIAYHEELEHSFNVKNFDPILDMFHKIFLSSLQQKTNLINREHEELSRELLEYQNEKMPEVCFVENALEELSIRKTSLDQLVVEESLLNLLNIKPAAVGENDYTYFYQCLDGQHIYLHSINIRMLKHEYQELKYCPESIIGKVIDLHRQTVNEDIRKRFAHLRHLPVSCEFIIAEVEFDQNVISEKTLDHFRMEINKRKKERKRRETAQIIRDRNIEIENNRKFFNMHPLSDFNIKDEDFPSYHLDNEEEFSGLDSGVPIPIVAEQCKTASTPSPSSSFQSSFANMLAAGKSHFDETVRIKKNSPPKNETSDEEQNPTSMAPMDLTLSDYFEQCIKVKNKNKGKKSKKN